MQNVGDEYPNREAELVLERAVSLYPQEAVAPPEIGRMRFAAGKGGGDFVPKMGFGAGERLKACFFCAEAEVGFFPDEEKALLQVADLFDHRPFDHKTGSTDIIDLFGFLPEKAILFLAVADKREGSCFPVPIASEVIQGVPLIK